MPVTFENLKTKIGEWLGIDQEDDDERLPLATRGDIINIVMRDYLRRRESRFGEFSDTFPTVASQKNYAVPSTWSKPGQIWYINPDTANVVFLTYYANKQLFDKKFPDATKTGDPEAYTIWAEEILLGKTPERVLTLNRDYYRILAELVDGSPNNENIFTQQAWEYLLFASLVESTEFGIEDDRLPTWERAKGRFEFALDSEDSRRRQVGRTSQGTEPG